MGPADIAMAYKPRRCPEIDEKHRRLKKHVHIITCAHAVIYQSFTGTLQNSTKRGTVEQVAKFQVIAEHLVTLMPAEPLQFGGVHAAVHAGGQRRA